MKNLSVSRAARMKGVFRPTISIGAVNQRNKPCRLGSAHQGRNHKSRCSRVGGLALPSVVARPPKSSASRVARNYARAPAHVHSNATCRARRSVVFAAAVTHLENEANEAARARVARMIRIRRFFYAHHQGMRWHHGMPYQLTSHIRPSVIRI